MDYFILIIVFSLILGGVIVYYEHRISVLLKVPVSCPPLDDALKSARAIGHFLLIRANGNSKILIDKVGYGEYSRTDVFNIYWGENYQVVTFIRLCHALGCEVVVRQVGTEDIERSRIPEEGTKDVIC